MTAPRTDQLEAFLTLLKEEGRRSVLGLDCGTGTEGLRFVRAGIHFTGVDASEENIHAARAHGLSASVATGRALPFADAAFAAVWAPDALAALTPLEQDDAVRELTRVAGPGAPVAVVFPEWHSHHFSAGFTLLRSPA
ncbi:MAG TPA: methyltransferase domain-containing protein [Arthrobacter sp.]|nr:methyltransferase domain-containing protein [Arthrobacter sp.]